MLFFFLTNCNLQLASKIKYLLSTNICDELVQFAIVSVGPGGRRPAYDLQEQDTEAEDVRFDRANSIRGILWSYVAT